MYPNLIQNVIKYYIEADMFIKKSLELQVKEKSIQCQVDFNFNSWHGYYNYCL